MAVDALAEAFDDARAAPESGEHAPEAAPGAEVFLQSWNVAGWKTVMGHLRKFGGLQQFLTKHRPAVLCLQETKLTGRVVADEWASLGANIPEYESFWACNEGKGGQRQGLNGVATLARKGSVLRADPSPLGCPDLDAEGRCLQTDHGSFVIFNVYVPNSSGGARLPYKLRWLQALRAAMQRARSQGKSVILAGDLNMKHRAVDSYWASRLLSEASLVDLLRSESADGQVLAAASTAKEHWPTLERALRAREVRELEVKGAQAGKVSERWGIFVSGKGGQLCRLGPQFESEAGARMKFCIDGIGCSQDGGTVTGAASREAKLTMQRCGELPIHEVVECLSKIVGVELPRCALKAISAAAGKASTEPSVQAWLEAVFSEDGMVDSFAELYPNAVDRFTCWDQSKNNRHENIGARIDHILVDRKFFEQHARRGLGLYTGGVPGRLMADSAEAALAAATLGGRMAPLSPAEKFAGGGMAELEEDEYSAQFRSAPSSGIVYTPQQLSDHVAVSLLLCGVDSPLGAGLELAGDPATRRSQPHRTVKRISEFFARKTEPARCAPTSKRPPAPGGSPTSPTKRQAL